MQPEPSEKTSLVGERPGELEGLKRSFRAEITEGDLAFGGRERPRKDVGVGKEQVQDGIMDTREKVVLAGDDHDIMSTRRHTY